MDPQRIIVAVKWGASAGRKAVVVPGQLVRVGRGALADLVVPGDPQMSAVHLEIAWNGQSCTFRDLASARGTSRNGEPGVTEGDLRHGDWLKAGDTVLTIHKEGATPPPRTTMDDDVDDEDQPPDEAEAASRERDERRERESSAARALAVLQETENQPLYAVLDAARDRRILELLRESVEEHHSLYDGIEGETMAHVAPYLVRLEPGSRLLAALTREGWGKRWGIYLTSPQPFKSVRRHLRRYLMVERQDNHEKVYFRFYDPAVLRVFLPASTVLQRSELFGALDQLLFEGEQGEVTVHRAIPREPV